MHILQAAQELRPGTSWNLRGDKLEQAEDGTARVVYPPTLEECQAIVDQWSYQEKRRDEYPPLQDFADAYIALQNGDPSLMKSYVDACNAVKAKYPKPKKGGG